MVPKVASRQGRCPLPSRDWLPVQIYTPSRHAIGSRLHVASANNWGGNGEANNEPGLTDEFSSPALCRHEYIFGRCYGNKFSSGGAACLQGLNARDEP
eukprot:348054-Prorocentrum_minimum.AAC.8